MAEAGRLLAIVCRRRDVDEPPRGKGTPTVARQLAAMLPDSMGGLITQALQIAKKHTGEDPLWTRRDGIGLELARSLGVVDHDSGRRRGGQAWQRERDRGLSF